MELMNEDDPQMLQQQADEAAIKANRGGTPDRTLTPSSTIQDLGMQSVAQMKDFSKFNSMAMKLVGDQSKIDANKDGEITGEDFKILQK
tara:strand:- start:804 stop:1070 length:267 start_codon:yes stop_codon:yes gene_type:complete